MFEKNTCTYYKPHEEGLVSIKRFDPAFGTNAVPTDNIYGVLQFIKAIKDEMMYSSSQSKCNKNY